MGNGNKKLTYAMLLAGSMAISSAAQAGLLGSVTTLLNNTHPILTFDFDGDYQLFFGETALGSPAAIGGTIKLDALTFGGQASMSGFFGPLPFQASGPLSAYLNPLGLLGVNGGPCNGPTTELMCADASINFVINGASVPVETSFALSPGGIFSGQLSALPMGFQFNVTTLDTDGDGRPGGAIVAPGSPFDGFTPVFSGVATLSAVQLSRGIPRPDQVGTVPEPGEWAMLAVGLGLVAYKVHWRRKHMNHAIA
ncbi:MAG: hypothetical protein LDL19_01270 [Thiobacillus sp.]|nr:hypothetical protein [Thiobacillus sp.]